MLRGTRIILAAVTVVVAAVMIGVSSLNQAPVANKVTLVLKARVGTEPLVYNKFIYTNPGGSETFRIRDFRFYISNVRLYGEGGDYAEVDSYHLARFDNEQGAFSVTLSDVPLREVTKVAFSIGVDADANTSIRSVGDLDPNSQMAWNWKVGYKFVLLEGGIQLEDQVHPLVYHVGFSENRRDLEFTAPQDISLGENTTIQFTADVMKFFDSTTTVDMKTLQSVKFDKKDARMLADNYKTMISANW